MAYLQESSIIPLTLCNDPYFCIKETRIFFYINLSYSFLLLIILIISGGTVTLYKSQAIVVILKSTYGVLFLLCYFEQSYR